MPKIRFSTRADVFDHNEIDPETGESRFIDTPAILRTLDGLSYQDESLVEYLCDGENTSDLSRIGIQGGVLAFRFDEKTQCLLAFTDYLLPRELSAEEVEILKDYTSGQWIDGIGSNFYQDRMDHGLAPQVAFDDEILVEHSI